MDHVTFDRIAAALGGATTRRVGIRTALALLTGRVATSDGQAAARSRQEPEREGPSDEKRPCGPTAAQNKCRKHKDCCTKYCKPPKGKAKVGRCRCIKPGKKCKNGQTCCGGATCQHRKCTAASGCGATGGACTTDATCCAGLICRNGSCGACAPDVCASGCAFTTVNDAYAAATAGSAIYIGPGTYPTGFEVTKDITLAACPGVTGVVLTPDRILMDADSYYVAIKGGTGPASYTVTLNNVSFAGSYPTNQDEALLSAVDGAPVTWVIDGCELTDAYAGINSTGADVTVTNSKFLRTYQAAILNIERNTTMTLTDVTMKENADSLFYIDVTDGIEFHATFLRGIIDNNQAYFYADAMNTSDTASDRAKTTLTFTGTTFTNQSKGVLYLYGGVITLTDCSVTGSGETPLYVADGDLIVNNTIISGNTGEYNNFTSKTNGGGIHILADDQNAALTLGAGTQVTNNTAQDGAGLLTDRNPSKTLTLTGVSNTTVFGNNGPNCSEYNGSTNPEVPNCSYP